MSDRKNIEYEIFEKLENATTKIAQKVYDALNREGIAGIIADTKITCFGLSIIQAEIIALHTFMNG